MCTIEVGGALKTSARNAVQIIPFFWVARMRADPRPMGPIPGLPSGGTQALAGPKTTVPLEGISSDVALGSLIAAPPGPAKASTPTRIDASEVLVHAKKGSM